VLDYIRSYSPCENILKHSHSSKGTPAVLISVGLRDDKVSPEESFKWISLLRQHLSVLPMATSRAPLLLHIQDQGGHDGSSSLTEQFHDQAVEIAFLESQTSTPLPHPL
jgi:protease II